ncbi:HAD family hydrolase [Staphylococcus lutrae]|uniref:HAD family hydrolase n=1 Tax=Staphylococcus lutrae TaxID=155085 RepID=A0AAC9WM79_9STAP|nr:HAD-IA family hydrolase [Staphylococcus lutrae]ARJ50477.1 HAD family hydrolase [Staphylococcus lutrae]PNZ38205.1 HAD family hydrolase [Staphylococcus lutrae]
MYRAVIFDFDGTIIDTEQHLFNSVNHYLKEAGQPCVSEAFYRSNIGGRALGLHQHLLTHIGESLTQQLYQEHYETASELPLRPGVLALMQQLHQRHIPMGIATSSTRQHIEVLTQKLGINQYISTIKGREDVEAVKPAPDLYLTVVQALNFLPTQCLAIEDSVKGATAAVHAGLDVIVNPNVFTAKSDFSELNLLAKSVDLTQVVSKYFDEESQ